MNRAAKPIDHPKDIPAGLSDEERMAFLEEHGVSEYFMENTQEAPEEERPRPRSKPINVRFDDFTLARLKALADSRNIPYQTLLKTFVQERLYEEEKRGDVFSSSDVAESGRFGAAEGKEAPAKRGQKINDLLNRVHDYVKENEKLLEDPELTSIATARLASDSSAMLKKLGEDITRASRIQGYPVSTLHRMEKAFHKLAPFVTRVIETYKERFGMDEEDAEEEYDIIREAERIRDSS